MYRGQRFNSLTHTAGAALSLAGLVVLVVRASRGGDPGKIAGVSIYGAALVLLYAFSSLYHSVRGNAKQVFRKLDHIAIYLLIAGTYTPFTLVTLRGAWGWSLFCVVWGLAVLGIIQEFLFGRRRRVLSVALSVLMGWLVLIALRPLKQALPAAGLAWLTAGGLFYTVGILFYAFDKKLPLGHGIWHLFVLAGSVCHYITVLAFVA